MLNLKPPPWHPYPVHRRPRGRHLQPHQRVKIVELKDIGWSYRAIQERYPDIPLSTIKSTVLQPNKRGPTQASLQRSGRPQKLSIEDNILQAIEIDSRINIDKLLEAIGYRVSRTTLCDFFAVKINANGFVFNDQKLMKKLPANALNGQSLSIFWSDESTVERGKGIRREWTFTRPKFQIPTCDVQTFSVYKGVKQMFWAAFSGCGRRTGLIPLFGRADSPRGGVNRWAILELYQRVLPTLINGIEGAIFQQDNAPVHTAFVVRDWLAEQEFEIMNWPPYSPDLNPIENLWALLKAKIYDLHPEIKDMDDNEETYLTIVAQEAWSEMDTAMIENLAVTMPHRVQQVLDNQGWYTSY
ncbi:hypothetical protein N7526_010910 [Penicillium atrosanguineum]|nr:hypothetical protein N7526_010910 [Penicillium atrosanguineum]